MSTYTKYERDCWICHEKFTVSALQYGGNNRKTCYKCRPEGLPPYVYRRLDSAAYEYVRSLEKLINKNYASSQYNREKEKLHKRLIKKQHDALKNFNIINQIIISEQDVVELYKFSNLNVKTTAESLSTTTDSITRIVKAHGLPTPRMNMIPLVMVDTKTSEDIRTFNNIIEASEYLGISLRQANHINDVCQGKRKSSHGYSWRYQQMPVQDNPVVTFDDIKYINQCVQIAQCVDDNAVDELHRRLAAKFNISIDDVLAIKNGNFMDVLKKYFPHRE